MLVERQIGHWALELRLLLIQQPQLPHLHRSQVAQLPLPNVKSSLAGPHLPAYVGHCRPPFGLPERIADLLIRVFGTLHRPPLLWHPGAPCGGLEKRIYSSIELTEKTGLGSLHET